MKGSIHSDQTCPVCGNRFKSFEPHGMWCPDHPDHRPTAFIVRFGKITRRFRLQDGGYHSAFQFLTGLRYEAGKGTFDERDYQVKSKPFGFANLTAQWLEIKQKTVSRSHYRNLRGYIHRAVLAWNQTNIKDIRYGEIEDLILAQTDISDKTKANMLSGLHDFFTWLSKRRVLDQIPEFPEVSYTLEYRKTVSLDVQEKILARVKALTWSINPKVWLCCRMLATYIDLRPSELLAAKEGDFDLDRGLLIIPHPKEREPKMVWLLDEDVALIRSLSEAPALPHVHFFRHVRGTNNAVREGAPIRLTMIYRWWKKACAAEGVECDLYGGTRHSKAMALGEVATPEEIRHATNHRTNKAFDRYFQRSAREYRDIISRTRKKADVVRLKKEGNS